jgi:S-DNA-T family DNA segregation ATPase FtsK/SpoIIIE
MNLFLGDIGYLKKRDGSTYANLIEIKYSWCDLPANIPLRSVPVVASGKVIFGLSTDGFYSLSFEDMVHLGVSGETGSGKSVFLRQLITQILVTDRQAVMIGIDFKGGVEFSFFSQLGNFVCVDDFDKAGKALEIILNEYVRRLKIVRENNCDSVYDLRNKGLHLSPIFVLVDEGAEFFGNKKQSRIYELVSKIARLGRFAGIHLIISTQRADVEAIPQQIRSMLVTRVIFKVSQKEDSLMFIGTAEATKLRKLPGRFYVKDSEGRLKECQAPYVSKAEVKEILSRVQRDQNQNGLMKSLRSVIYENESPAQVDRSRATSAPVIGLKVAA